MIIYERNRQRLEKAMLCKSLSKSALSRETKVDRSTIGKLLKDDHPRLPNAQLAADAADAFGVSIDWLLGLTNRPETPGDIVAAALSLSPAERTSTDEQLLEWHREAAGYKVRHVPATLPDILKTKSMLKWEYASVQERRLPEAFDAMQDQLEWLSSGVSDYEIAIPLHEIEACAAGTAYYSGVDESIRHEQLNFIADQCDQMFPRLRIFLVDAHRVLAHPSPYLVQIWRSYISDNATSHFVRVNALNHSQVILTGLSAKHVWTPDMPQPSFGR